MRALDIHEHLRKVGTWVDWSHTCDGFKVGDPQTELTGIAVAWTPALRAVREAHSLGCNMFIAHEPAFYDHDVLTDRSEPGLAKQTFLEETAMALYRCHDVWDVMPEIGIVDSWSRGLELEQPPIAAAKYYSVHHSPAATLGELAAHVAAKTHSIGQEAVQYVGDPQQPVSKVGVGTGAITRVDTMLELGADALIVTDDGIRFWSAGARAIDLNVPMIVVNHATAEEWGVTNLAAYLGRQFPEIPVRHIPQGCMYRVVSG